MGSNPTASASRSRTGSVASLALALLVAACSSVPGETMSSGAVQRDVRERAFGLARTAEPQCRQQKIAHTEILEVHPDGTAAEELWTVEHCGRRLDYVVSFPPRRATGKSLGFTVRPRR